jgi:hypothetical protein
LATLKGMNFNMGDVANALKLKAADTMFSGVQKASETAAATAKAVSGAAQKAATKTKTARKKADDKPASTGVVDPLQWWGALTQQFQQIAAGAMKDAAAQTAVDTARNMATGVAKEAMKTATGMAKAATHTMTGGRKASARRTAKKASGR